MAWVDFLREALSHRIISKDMADGVIRGVSTGVHWEVDLPPPQTHWDYWSPYVTLRDIKYRFNLYPGGLNSDGVYLRFVVQVPNTALFPLHLRWQMGVKRVDGVGFQWLMNEETSVEEECNTHVQQVRIRRAELERLLSPDARLTFFHRLDVGNVDANPQVSTQTEDPCLDETQVSCETKTEEESVATAVEKPSNLDTKEIEELREHFRLWLRNPKEGDRIRELRRLKYEANHGKSIWNLPEGEKQPLIFAA